MEARRPDFDRSVLRGKGFSLGRVGRPRASLSHTFDERNRMPVWTDDRLKTAYDGGGGLLSQVPPPE
ncbi:hypothetical protein GCM10011335_49180 [Aureimonas glaciei]|uniref:Uncharacterized protein n=1 Tax=Aureimonas glaciei TaxID=1776957 RepID=A0A916YD37_9HYPH|nr:hypothetical protein GCM10011335_49180 [Aureimonas glaciei]